ERTRATDAPTVPRPAIPTRNASAICRKVLQVSNGPFRAGSAPRRQRLHVVGLIGRRREETFDIARSLTDAVLVFHECQAHIVVAVLPEAYPRRYRDIGMLDQQL